MNKYRVYFNNGHSTVVQALSVSLTQGHLEFGSKAGYVGSFTIASFVEDNIVGYEKIGGE